MATRSGSPNRTPISTARPSVAYAVEGSESKHWIASGTSSHPRSTQSWSCSSSIRRALASQPPPRASSPITSSCVPSRRADRAAPRRSPRRTHSWWARTQTSMLSSSRPTRYAATASRSRSSRASGASTSAADSWTYASPHACRPNDARPSSSARAPWTIDLSLLPLRPGVAAHTEPATQEAVSTTPTARHPTRRARFVVADRTRYPISSALRDTHPATCSHGRRSTPPSRLTSTNEGSTR